MTGTHPDGGRVCKFGRRDIQIRTYTLSDQFRGPAVGWHVERDRQEGQFSVSAGIALGRFRRGVAVTCIREWIEDTP